MSNHKIISKKPVSLSYVSKIIDTKKNFTYREEKLSEYSKKFLKNNFNDFEKKFNSLKDLNIEKLEEKDLIKLIDLMPKNGVQIRAIIQKGVILVDEEVDKILNVLK